VPTAPDHPRHWPTHGHGVVAAVSDAGQVHNGRQFAAWLSLVPRQHTTGGKERLLGMSKRGDGYLRKLLVHGARATVPWVGSNADRRRQWIRQLVERRGRNRTAVAVANKNARIVWVLLSRQQDYRPVTTSRRPTQVARGQRRRQAHRSTSAHRDFRRLLRLRARACRTPRGVIGVMTREVSPASPDADVVKGHAGRSCDQEEKRACHQGPKAGSGLHQKAG
jgi:hypothetical protein